MLAWQMLCHISSQYFFPECEFCRFSANFADLVLFCSHLDPGMWNKSLWSPTQSRVVWQTIQGAISVHLLLSVHWGFIAYSISYHNLLLIPRSWRWNRLTCHCWSVRSLDPQWIKALVLSSHRFAGGICGFYLPSSHGVLGFESGLISICLYVSFHNKPFTMVKCLPGVNPRRMKMEHQRKSTKPVVWANRTNHFPLIAPLVTNILCS